MSEVYELFFMSAASVIYCCITNSPKTEMLPYSSLRLALPSYFCPLQDFFPLWHLSPLYTLYQETPPRTSISGEHSLHSWHGALTMIIISGTYFPSTRSLLQAPWAHLVTKTNHDPHRHTITLLFLFFRMLNPLHFIRSTHLSIYLSSIHLPIHPSSVHPFIHPSCVHPSIHPSSIYPVFINPFLGVFHCTEHWDHYQEESGMAPDL